MIARTSRSSWLRSAAASALLTPAALLGAPVSAQAVTIRLATTPNEGGADIFYAADMGYFSRAGLTAEIQVLQNGAAVGAAIAGGSLDVGFSSSLVFMNARRHGLPYTMIAPAAVYLSAEALSAIVVAAASPVRTAHDLNGKTICGGTVGALDQLGCFAWLDQNGGDSSSVKFIEVPIPATVDALEQNRVAAAMLPDPFLSNAGNRVRILGKAFDAIGKTFLLSCWFTSTDYASKNPQTVRRFADAMSQASAWAAANREQAAVILEKYTKIKVPKIRSTSARSLDPAFIQPICDLAYKYKLIDAPMNARDFIWSARS
jgi:NitT/TauT family transport system substrate-binding protein